MKYKNIPRLFLNKELKKNLILEISSKDKHYLCNVMRLKQGESLKIFNGLDGEWEASVLSIKNSTIKCLKQYRKQKKLKGPSIYFSLIKSTHLRWMIEKLTELGVVRLIPVITERTNIKNLNRKRILAHIKEASEVSGRIDLPILEETKTLKKILENIESEEENLIFCNENRDDKYLSELFKQKFIRNVSFLIGPEGGFSPAELKLLKEKKNVVPVKLNNRILRADTAAVLAVSIYNCYNIA